MQKTLDGAVRRRETCEEFDVADVETMRTVDAPPTNTVSYHTAPPTPFAAPIGLAWPSIDASAGPMAKAQRSDLASAAEKDAFRTLYALKIRQRSIEMENRKRPSPRHRAVKDDVEELVEVGFKNMAHEEAAKIRADLRMVLTDAVRVLNVRYLQENQMELVTP